MAAENEYTIQIGIDASPFTKGLQKMKDDIESLQKLTKQSTNAMGDNFAQLGKAVSRMSEDAVKSVRNIGNAVKDITAYSKPLRSMFDSFDTKGLDGAGSSIKQVTKQLEQLLAKAKENKGIGVSDDDIKNADEYNKKIEDLEEALKQLKETGEEVFEKLNKGAEEFAKNLEEIQKKAADAKDATDEIKLPGADGADNGKEGGGDTKNEVKVEAKTSGIKEAVEGVKQISEVLETAKGAAEVFGESGEFVVKSLEKMNAVMSGTQKVLEFLAILDKNSEANQKLRAILTQGETAAIAEKTTATGAQAGADVALAGAEEGATAAQIALNAAMDANPVGVIIVAVTALIALMSLFGDSQKEADEKALAYNKALEEQNQLLVQLADDYTQVNRDNIDHAEKDLALAEARGASEEEIYKKKQALNSAHEAEGKAILANLGLTDKELSLKETELTMRREELQAILSLQTADRELTDEEKRQVEILKSKIGGLETIVTKGKEAQKKITDARAQGEDDAAAHAKTQLENSLKSAEAYDEAKAEMAKKGSAEELEFRKKAIDDHAALEIKTAHLTDGEIFKIQQEAKLKKQQLDKDFAIGQINNDISAQKTIIANSIAGSKEEFDARIKILQDQRDIELKNAGTNATKRAEIEAEFNRQKADMTVQFNKEYVTANLNGELDKVNAQLAITQKGTESELNLKKYAITMQAGIQAEAARAQIHDEQLLQDKLKDIQAQALKQQTDLDNDYLKNKLASFTEYLNSVDAIEKAKQQAKIDSPNASKNDTYQAQRKILQLELEDQNRQQGQLFLSYMRHEITYEQYQTGLNKIAADGVKTRQSLYNLDYNNQNNFTVGGFFKKITGKLIDSLTKDVPEDEKAKVKGAYAALFSDIADTVGKLIPQIFAESEASAQKAIDKITEVINNLQDQIDKQQEAVDKQQELSDQGLANDLTNQQKKLDDLKAKKEQEVKAQEEAQKKLEQIKKQEAIIQQASVVATNIETGVNMVNAMSEIFEAHASIPFAGIAIAIGLGALMLSTFLSIKSAIRSASSDTPKMRRGGGFLLDGPSHEDGGIGLYSGGRKLAEYEGDEYLFAINRNSTRKYLPLLEAINSDRLPAMQAILNNGRLPMDDVQQILVTHREAEDISIASSIQLHNRQLDSLKHLHHLPRIEEALKATRKEVTDMGDHILEREGNRTRKVRKG